MNEYNHREAFCLMKYATDDRSVVEVIWNSRDGVTPYCIRSADGTREMRHIEFADDRRAPRHLPDVGDRIFVDLTMERAIEHRTKYVEHFWDHEQYPMNDRYESKEAAIRELAHADLRQGFDGMTQEEITAYGSGPPDLVVVDAERLAAITARHLNRAIADSQAQLASLRGGG